MDICKNSSVLTSALTTTYDGLINDTDDRTCVLMQMMFKNVFFKSE